MSERRDLRGRTKEYALRIIHLYGQLPRTEAARVLGRQLLRSGTSVGANYREARRGRSKAEFAAKLGDCLKELDESEYWLELLAASKTISADRLEASLTETQELMAIFYTIIRQQRDQ